MTGIRVDVKTGKSSKFEAEDIVTPIGLLQQIARNSRDAALKQLDWRISRHERELRLSLTPTDSIESLDMHMQALANASLSDEWGTDPIGVVDTIIAESSVG